MTKAPSIPIPTVPRARFIVPLSLLLGLACRDERAPHVFRAPAPRPAATPAAADAPAAPEVPFGSTGADARIVAVMDAATGAPIALTDIRDSVVVMATFARGPGWISKEPLEVQVMFSGACEGVTSLLFPAPAPVVIAHQFLLRVRGQGALCTRGGSSSARAVLLGPNARVLAVSVPLRLVIRQSP